MKPTSPQKVPHGRELLTLIVALLLVLSIAALSYASWQGFRRVSIQLEITRRVIRSANAFLSTLKDAETGQRGFLLTGQANYLEPYRQAISAIAPNLTELTNATSTRPDQAARVQRIKPLVEKNLGELQQTIDLRQSQRPEAALAVVTSGEGRAVMDQIRQIVAEMETVANGRFARESEDQNVIPTVVIEIVSVGEEVFGVSVVFAESTLEARHADFGDGAELEFERFLSGSVFVAIFEVGTFIPKRTGDHVHFSVVIEVSKIRAFSPELVGHLDLFEAVNCGVSGKE